MAGKTRTAPAESTKGIYVLDREAAAIFEEHPQFDWSPTEAAYLQIALLEYRLPRLAGHDRRRARYTIKWLWDSLSGDAGAWTGGLT